MPDGSRPSSPEQNLWDSILNSVSTRRSVPSGNVLILGEPSTGKTTLANALLQRATTSATGIADAAAGAGGSEWTGKTDFALGYQWANVKEEGEEDVVARLSVYSVPSSDPSHLALVPHFLPPKTALPRTLIVIVLDWTKPWSFIEQLRTWLTWVEEWAEKDKSRDVQVLREEGRERLHSHLQHYTEPAGAGSVTEPVATVTSSINSTLLPLADGTFTHNFAGIPIIVTCTKADLIDEEEDVGLGMTKGKGGEWEERTDGVMQVLRTICLKYGAALFYTTPQPSTLSLLRQYVLHFLFMPPPPPPDSPPLKYPFPFAHRPNTLDRDKIMAPAGWDTWGKIAVLRDGFDAAKWGEAWEKDLDADAGATVPGGAKDMFKSLVGEDRGSKAVPLPALVTTEAEQTFLGHHFETLSKDPARDPRQQFRQQVSALESISGGASDPGFGAGVVGPMGGASSLSLPSVKAAMAESEGDDLSGRIHRAALDKAAPRRQDPRSAAHQNLPNITTPSLSQSTANLPIRPSSRTGANPSPSPGGAANGRAHHDTLQQFFASLLTNRSGAGGPGPSPTTAIPPSGSPVLSPQPNGTPRSRTTSSSNTGADV